jgi:hypothetical protein
MHQGEEEMNVANPGMKEQLIGVGEEKGIG